MQPAFYPTPTLEIRGGASFGIMQTISPTLIRPSLRLLFAMPVIVSALGFFVDVYDMLIFSIVRVPSL